MTPASRPNPADMSVIGGAGHVGLPLAIAFASNGQRVLVYDTNKIALEKIGAGSLPFMEHGAEPLLREALAKDRLILSSDPSCLAGVPILIVTIGTPMDEFMNPSFPAMGRFIEELLPYLSDEQILILRSTVYPGTTEWLDQYLRSKGKRLRLAFCPERIVQGFAIEELGKFPQIISGTTPEAEDLAAEIFLQIAPEIVLLKPKEAEFAKLFCNAYRYIQFAVTNQFYMMANSAGSDYYRILEGMKQNYSRMRDIPGAGFSAGPCLLKDTMQLTAFFNNEFSLGYTAMLVNEGLPLYIVDRIAQEHDLAKLTVGLLGMAFKADIDDPRSSLSYKLKKVLLFRAKTVLATDPYVSEDSNLLPVDEVISRSDIVILCVPHSCYKHLDTQGKPVVDIWNFFGSGGRM